MVMEIITCHINADFDCLSGMIGAKKLFPSAQIVFPGAQEKKVRDFLDVYPVETMKIKDVVPEEVSRLIIVDTKKADRLGDLKNITDRLDARDIWIYDHHPFAEDEIRGGVEVIEDVGATATIFTELIREKKIPVDPMEATILCLGIYEETGSMRYPSTTERDLLAVAYLLRRGANLKIVSEFVKAELSRDELELLNILVNSIRTIVIHGIRIAFCKAEREEYLGDVAHLAHRIMDMEDIDAVILMLGMEGKVVIIGRSSVNVLNMGELFESFGGGGHAFAASATIKERPLELLEEELTNKLRETIKPRKTIADIMTRHVITISWNESIKEAESRMTKYGVNVLPVVKDGDYLGILMREIVEKALYHGFHKSRAEDFTTTDALVAGANDSVRDIEARMIEQNHRFVTVLDGNRIIGAITRTDLLRNLYEDFLKRSRIGKERLTVRSPIGRNITSMMNERFPRSVVDILRNAGTLAEELGYMVFLVGGTVRDLLLGNRNLDIDIVIEGDGIRFARRLAKEYKAKIKTHERFSTAKVIFPALTDLERELTIDIATARTEYYEKPASLPKVEMSSIKKDLYRRDFTINTLAVRLNREKYGTLFDFFGGQRDIKEKVIRVLHNLSFIEDPTRAFRAVRFAERFGFRISKHTLNLMRSAQKLALFDHLSGSRLYDELILTFHETEPVKALKKLSENDLLKVIHPSLRFNDEIEELLNVVHETIAWYLLLFTEDKPKEEQIYLMALLSQLTSGEKASALTRLSTPENVRKRILQRFVRAQEIIRKMNTLDPARIYHVLNGIEIETVLYAMAVSKDREKQKAMSRYLIDLRYVRPSINGKDLQKLSIPPGPVYSRILQEVLEEKLRGKLITKDDEISYVGQLIEKRPARKKVKAKKAKKKISLVKKRKTVKKTAAIKKKAKKK